MFTGVMDYIKACIVHLTPGVVHNFPKLYRISVPYARKDPRFLFEKRKGILVPCLHNRWYYSTPGLCGKTAMLNMN